MAQQINLCTPILLKPKHYFSAQMMVLTLGLFVVVGGALCATWVWNLHRATTELGQVMQSQSRDIDNLKAAIQRSRAAAAPVDPALLLQLENTRTAVHNRQSLLDALREGMLVPGWGHSDRLLWVARSIPAPVWVTEIKMEQGRFEVAGFTLEPAALNAWVDKLAANPLMQGMKLATVKVESAQAAQLRMPASVAAVGLPGPSAAGAPATQTAASRPVWSFSLLSAVPVVATPSAGGKP